MTAPNYNATTPKDVTDLTANLWQARRLLVDAKRLISATALTPGDFDSQEDFEDNVLERLEVQKNFLLILFYFYSIFILNIPLNLIIIKGKI